MIIYCSQCQFVLSVNTTLFDFYKLSGYFHVPSFEHMIVQNVDEFRHHSPYYQLHPFPRLCTCIYIVAGIIQRKWRAFITRKKYLEALPLQRMYEGCNCQYPMYKISPDTLHHIFSYLFGESSPRLPNQQLIDRDEFEYAKSL